MRLRASVLGAGGDARARANQERIGGAQQLLHPCPAQAVGDEPPRSFGLNEAAVAQTAEVLGHRGLPHSSGRDHFADGSWTIPQREQTGEAGGIGEAPKERRQERGRGGRVDHGESPRQYILSEEYVNRRSSLWQEPH
jgi:hypothetical protein